MTPLEQVQSRGPVRGRLPLVGPAFVAAIAYVDPGNFATNFSAGSQFGYRLLWVIVMANLVAMLIQALSGKMGLATGCNLAELCREHYPRRVTVGLWAQAELVAIATDLAEIIGGAIALQLLFGIPLLAGGVITSLVAFALLALQGRGYRPFELAIVGLLAVITLGFLYSLLRSGVDGGELAAGLVPSFDGSDSLVLATGILGATVMPHVIYLHSALTQDRIPGRDRAEVRTLLRHQRLDVVVAMGVAGLVNASMLVIAAQQLRGIEDTDTLEGGARGPGPDRRRTSGFRVRCRVAGVGLRLLGRGDVRRSGRHAGLPTAPDLTAAASARDQPAGAVRAGRRGRADPGAGAQPGGAVVRHPVRARAAGAADPQA